MGQLNEAISSRTRCNLHTSAGISQTSFIRNKTESSRLKFGTFVIYFVYLRRNTAAWEDYIPPYLNLIGTNPKMMEQPPRTDMATTFVLTRSMMTYKSVRNWARKHFPALDRLFLFFFLGHSRLIFFKVYFEGTSGTCFGLLALFVFPFS